MADLRYDPVTGVWVAIAKKRRERPMEFLPLEQVLPQIICPFCGGNEDETPEPVIAYSADGKVMTTADDASGWSVRIINNKFPSLIQPETGSPSGPYGCSIDDGIQELLIPTPRHIVSMGDLSPDELTFVLACCQDRVGQLRQLDTIEHVMLFLNCRSAAGASMEHLHFQIMGSPVVSSFLQSRWERNEKSLNESGRGLLCQLMHWELQQEKRIIRETENFVMFCPYASRFAFQVWIVPREQNLSFANKPVDFNAELADLCLGYVNKLESLFENPAYNLLLNLAPNRHRDREHWFIEIFPRLNKMAGFELGTDVWVNPVPPHLAARRLSL